MDSSFNELPLTSLQLRDSGEASGNLMNISKMLYLDAMLVVGMIACINTVYKRVLSCCNYL